MEVSTIKSTNSLHGTRANEELVSAPTATNALISEV
jgi:hypothetical protein